MYYIYYCIRHVGSFVLLIGGSCEGLVNLFTPEMKNKNKFVQACDLNAGDTEAQVICRQLGCNPIGAKRVDANM